MNNRIDSSNVLTIEELRELLSALPDDEIHVISFADTRKGAEPDAV